VVTGDLQNPETMSLREYASLVRRIELEANVRKTLGAGEVERIMPYMARALLRVKANEVRADEQEALQYYIEIAGSCLKKCMVEDPAAVELS
jgi:hypothetical protein